jgi:hypothetical protein
MLPIVEVVALNVISKSLEIKVVKQLPFAIRNACVLLYFFYLVEYSFFLEYEFMKKLFNSGGSLLKFDYFYCLRMLPLSFHQYNNDIDFKS